MPALPAGHGIFEEIERIGGARVLRQRIIRIVGNARDRVHDHVFHHRAKLNRVPDLRLVLARKVNTLGIAAALEVEDAIVATTMLVIANHRALRVGGKRRFARAGQPKEKGHISCRANIGRTMHGKDALLRQHVIHHAEDRLFDLARVLCAGDDNHALLKIDQDSRLRAQAIDLWNRQKFRRGDHRKGWLVCPLLFRRHANEQLAGEEFMPGIFSHDTNRQAMGWVCAHPGIQHKDLAPLEIGADPRQKAIKDGRLDGLVDLAPGDAVSVFGGADNELIFGRASGARACGGDQRAVGGQNGFVSGDGLLHQLGNGEIPVDGAQVGQTNFSQALMAGSNNSHVALPHLHWLLQRWTALSLRVSRVKAAHIRCWLLSKQKNLRKKYTLEAWLVSTNLPANPGAGYTSIEQKNVYSVCT